MIDLARVSERHFDALTPVVESLVATAGLEPHRILLIGALCRDVLHAAAGHTFALRATLDLDLGIAVDDWTVTERLDEQFGRIGSNGIRYLIAGVPVDLVPFGGVEDPDGISRPAGRKDSDVVVFGFRDVYDHALSLTLPGGEAIRIPDPAGFTALKMRSWIDRSPDGQYKDAADLALAAYWYQVAQSVQDRLYDTDEGFEILSAREMDADLAAVSLLREDIARVLSSSNRIDLAERWAQTDGAILARNFSLPASGPRTPTLTRRKELIAQLSLSRR